ncbi:hypothetical protein WBV44_17730 [Acinetobacter baumannii]|uniref:hypothetical protein n=1 Tax=Acinetobacter baumannii TaxID=470 RepID=UPI00207C9CC1|nr:hypothetical protein [Acinetobacter baumannii]MCW1474064.1 hypothetical protein [Acinetobacter baumannii]MDC4689587.1 hypothetical protein [Acinetobacter baumannii]MDC4857614.1 hypothetical protein [Acinetobacter baumannii]HAV2818817.1 hypothetical protein [Acinetobacter baumannii]HAV5689763.1 hypothetical protein [Acinetobacter baumannii]
MLNIEDEKVMKGQFTQNVTVLNGGHLILRGQLTENLYIKTGGSAVIHGQIAKDLYIESGANVIIHGMVCGNLTNYGTFSGNGMIVGKIFNNKTLA